MFKSIKWKFVTVFVLLVITVVVLAGTFFRVSISNYYVREFGNKMGSVFGSEFSTQIQTTVENYENPVDQMKKILEIYSGRFALDVFRRAYILEGKTGRVIYSTDENANPNIERTPNIISALTGKIGSKVSERDNYMDYAYPIIKNGNSEYIVYIRDTKEELNDIINAIITIIMQALMFGLLISIFLGYFVSKTITSPIISLTKKAELIAKGDFDTKINIKADDEIGRLSKTFDNMSLTIQNNLGTIAKEKNKLETILLFLSDGVMAFERSGKAIHVNLTAQKMLNIGENSDLNFDNFFKNLGCNISIEELIFKENEIIERDLEVGDRFIKVFFGTTSTDVEKISGLLAVLHDITEQRKLDSIRREFVANVSHELRTPITTIKAYTETILETDDMTLDTAKSFLQVVLNEANRMTRLIQDLLMLSRLDFEKNNMPKEDFDIVNILNDVVSRLKMEADNHNHKINLIVEEDIPIFYGNRDRIEQVIINIVFNSIKYTPPGGNTEIKLYKKFDKLNILIKDNGIGIPSEDLKHIFDRFYRVDKARSRESGGTGLGLAIAKEIIEAHYGSISIKSKQDKGTEVLIKLPY